MYNNNKKIHFVGIGGVGMSPIAQILLNLGYKVSGSDLQTSASTDYLKQIGAEIYIEHKETNVDSSTEVVVISSAISKDNPEVRSAINQKIPIVKRAQMLAEIMRTKYGIAVSGSHGKTSTTSIIGKILTDANLDPTIVVGGKVLNQRIGAKLGTGKFMVAEADESDGSFKYLSPSITIITNLEAEHLDYYKTFTKIREEFLKFVQALPFYGLLVYCGDESVLKGIAEEADKRCISYGVSPKCDVQAKKIEILDSKTSFILHYKDEPPIQMEIPLIGEHLVKNCLAAICVAKELEISSEQIKKSVKSIKAVSRRMEIKYRDDKNLVIDDYAHHPTEINATLRAISASYMKKYKRLVCIFEPHRYSRFSQFFSNFLSSFDLADKLYITPVYSAGESPIENATSKSFIEAYKDSETEIINYETGAEIIKESLEEGDIVVSLGAGKVNLITSKLAELLENDI